MTCSGDRERRLGVDYGRPSRGNKRRLNDPHRTFTHRWLVYVVQRPLSRIAPMPATGQLETLGGDARTSRKRSPAGGSTMAEFHSSTRYSVMDRRTFAASFL